VKTAGHAAAIVVVSRLQAFWPLHHLPIAVHRRPNLQLEVPIELLPAISVIRSKIY
jgi:hypothetical protein